MYTFRRVAVSNLPADDRRTARENAFRAFGIISDPVVFIDEGQVHRQVGEHQVDLFQGHASRIKAQGPAQVFEHLCRLGSYFLGSLNDFCGPARIRNYPGETDVSLPLLDFDPFRFR